MWRDCVGKGFPSGQNLERATASPPACRASARYPTASDRCHTEQFVYIRVTDENLEAIARYVALCALT
jgi:hypothetical protein